MLPNLIGPLLRQQKMGNRHRRSRKISHGSKKRIYGTADVLFSHY